MYDDKFESLDWVPGEIRPEADYETEAAHAASQLSTPNWWPEPEPDQNEGDLADCGWTPGMVRAQEAAEAWDDYLNPCNW